MGLPQSKYYLISKYTYVPGAFHNVKSLSWILTEKQKFRKFIKLILFYFYSKEDLLYQLFICYLCGVL